MVRTATNKYLLYQDEKFVQMIKAYLNNIYEKELVQNQQTNNSEAGGSENGNSEDRNSEDGILKT
ncbi:12867_t:CDS:1, partial [Dentiscutata erythropus]